MYILLQVAAFMRGNAVNGTVKSSLSGVGTPNLLLQTDLSEQPTVTIAPDQLAPVVLFEGSFGTTSTQIITLTNTDSNNTSVDFQVYTTLCSKGPRGKIPKLLPCIVPCVACRILPMCRRLPQKSAPHGQVDPFELISCD